MPHIFCSKKEEEEEESDDEESEVMMMNFEAKQEGDDGKKKNKEETRKLGGGWGGLKNPRIVRVSRSLGGKDRHSKVCTIRGLRDRRIRLSVPTAIQLYDLQDRLGLSQPSKVVDWLLDATKLEIDKLPPLHFPPASFFDHPSSSSLLSPNILHHLDQKTHSTCGNKEKWAIDENQVIAAYNNNNNNNNVVPQNLFPLGTHSCFPPPAAAAALNSSSASTLPPYNNSYYHWDPSTLSLPQFHHNNPNLYLPSILPPPYMPDHLLTTSSTSHLIQNPPTLHFISSPINNNNNPENSSSRGS